MLNLPRHIWQVSRVEKKFGRLPGQKQQKLKRE